MTPQPSVYGQRMLDAARACLVATAASLPLSTAATNTFAVLALLCWALSAQWGPTLRTVAAEPVAWLGCILFAALAVGISWSLVPLREAAGTLLKYRELLFFCIAVALFADARWRMRLLGAFTAGMLVLLLLSQAIGFGLMQSVDTLGIANQQNAVVLKNAITHGLLMSMFAYGAAVLALRHAGWQRWTLAGIAAIAAVNVWFDVQGRTGYLVLSVLVLWLAYSRWSLRGLAAAAAGLVLLLAAAYQWAPVFKARVAQAVEEARDYRVQGDPGSTSIGSRLHFWKRSAQWLAAHPVLGAGTGGWGAAFYEATEGDRPFMHNREREHPHNEYVHLAVQLGPAGLALFLAMLVVAFRRAGQLPAAEAALAQGFVLAFAVGALFNDLLYDTTEGHLWAVLGGALFGSAQRRES